MYENFYKFRQKPFQLAPNPSFLYKSAKHQKALAYLEYGLAENVGIVVLTGEVGSGKTTCAQYVLKQLGNGFDIAMIANTNVSSGDMLKMVQSEFDIDSGQADKAAIIESLNYHFIAQYETGTRTLLVIDEAQNLSAAALEEVRMLSNLQADQYALLQILLIGQPELLETLKQPSMWQFAQRVAVSFHLTALDQNETAAYIAHRIKTAGGPEGLFTPAAVQAIYDLSGGIPRSINLICQAALVYGFADEAETISQDIIHQIHEDRIGVGIESEPEKTQANPESDGEIDVASAEGVNSRLLEETIDNIRMEVKGRIRQMEDDLNEQNNNLIRQVESLLIEKRRISRGYEHRITGLEQRMEDMNQLLQRMERRLHAYSCQK
ncbi:MAG: general secretion pathway protein [Proteobacteria bacterium]|nr:MAG: general secretion pathway protein [Pseudomonadota bacterium]PIE67458.1 MAG: general secretion pathway protein [Deltaproteobacteria bacterium]